MSFLHGVRAGALAFVVLLGHCLGASPNDLTISLKVQSGGREQTTASTQSAVPPVFSAKAKEVVWVQWSVTNGAASVSLSDVTLHVFMDSGDGRAVVPKPGLKTLYESALVQDFEVGVKSSGEFRMAIPEAGRYFVRVETIGAARKLGGEVNAVMQVSVK